VKAPNSFVKKVILKFGLSAYKQRINLRESYCMKLNQIIYDVRSWTKERI